MHNAAVASGWSEPKLVRDSRHIVVILATAGLTVSHRATFRVAHSFEEVAPDFTSAPSATNRWAYVQSYKLENGAPIDGSTGVEILGVDDVVNLEINQNLANWIAIELDDIDQGTASSMIVISSN